MNVLTYDKKKLFLIFLVVLLRLIIIHCKKKLSNLWATARTTSATEDSVRMDEFLEILGGND